ncbi:MAG TPA: SGNH/GDSL hydrolase family protein [Thermoanaerobaculia bacterium]|nr:SGNH/GDSL hydrolase family protein [Thermoanaerobaculia bacterium]
MPRARRRGRALALVVALLIGGEATARLWEALGASTTTLYEQVVPFRARFKMKPDREVRVPERYGTVVYRFNRAGYRDRDHVADSGRRSVVLLGDSVTFGLGAPQDAIYAAVLQHQLDAWRGPRHEVVNLAIFAYDSGHELQTLREEGLAYRPQVVVVQFFMNDLSEPPPGTPAVPPGALQRLRAARNVYLYRSALARRVHQGLTRLTYLLIHDVRRTRFPETLNADEPRGKLAYLAAHPDDATIPAFASLRAIRDAAAAQGARVLLLQTPDETQLYTTRYDAIDARVARFCARERIAYLDALPTLRAAPRHESIFLDGVHLSPRAHDLIGRRLASELVQRGLL